MPTPRPLASSRPIWLSGSRAPAGLLAIAQSTRQPAPQQVAAQRSIGRRLSPRTKALNDGASWLKVRSRIRQAASAVRLEEDDPDSVPPVATAAAAPAPAKRFEPVPGSPQSNAYALVVGVEKYRDLPDRRVPLRCVSFSEAPHHDPRSPRRKHFAWPSIRMRRAVTGEHLKWSKRASLSAAVSTSISPAWRT